MDFNIGDRVRFTEETIRLIDVNSLSGMSFKDFRDSTGIVKVINTHSIDILWELNNHYGRGYYPYRFERVEDSEIDKLFKTIIEEL